MSKYDDLPRKYDEDEVQFIREHTGDPSWNPPTTVVEDVREVKIITARLARKSDGVPQEHVQFKPLFLSKTITRDVCAFKETRTEIGLIFYPLEWIPESPAINGCAATYAAIEKHGKKYWNDDIKSAYKDYRLSEEGDDDQ